MKSYCVQIDQNQSEKTVPEWRKRKRRKHEKGRWEKGWGVGVSRACGREDERKNEQLKREVDMITMVEN